MPTSELITPAHLARKAIIYIRQSSPQQVLSNQESLRLQYALTDRARSLGWPPEAIEVIDTDLGLTASSAYHREGFKELIAQVTLGQVGIILSFDVTRLARNCSDWYPLLDLCGYKHCLIADRDGIYDPGSTNGRLLLGLKGQLSELELHTLRARLTAGLLHKAERGALALRLPIGLVRDGAGRVVKDPNQEIQDRLQLVFTIFLERRAASKVLEYFNAHDLRLPRHDRFGDVIWKFPTLGAILAILKNPAYAGAFVYGRTRTTSGPRPQDKTFTRLPLAQWRIRINDVYPAYITWETFERIQAMLLDNYAEYDRNKTRGVPRPGAALLHGIVYCGACGHKLVVQYKGKTRYICNYLRQQYRVPVCQYIPADAVDQAVVSAFLAALAPLELDVYNQAVAAQQQQLARIDQAQQQQVARLRYEAELAQRQFTRVDPDNRLVAATLERRWEEALRSLQQAEAAAAEQPATESVLALPAEMQARFREIGRQLPLLWSQGVIGQAHKKALLRCLIEKVVIVRVRPDQVEVRIIWRGGESTRQTIAVTVGALAHLSESTAMEDYILEQSALGSSDEEIAQQLSKQGYHSPRSAGEVLPNTVRIVRLKHRQFRKRSQSHPRQIAGYLTVPQVAQALDISPHWIYHRIDTGIIQVERDATTRLYLFPDTPATLELIRTLPDFPHTSTGTLEEHHHA